MTVPAHVTAPSSYPKWPAETGPFTTQAQLDLCAEELWTGLDEAGVARHIGSNMMRGRDADGDYRRLQIHNTDGVTGANAELGNILILFNGKVEALTPDEFAARGFTE